MLVKLIFVVIVVIEVAWGEYKSNKNCIYRCKIVPSDSPIYSQTMCSSGQLLSPNSTKYWRTVSLKCYHAAGHHVSLNSSCVWMFYVFDVIHTNSEGKPGIPLRVSMTVLDMKSCSSVVDVVVDMWHCDAMGIYQNVVGLSLGQTNAKPDNTTFFRGRILFIRYSLPLYYSKQIIG